MYYLNSRYYDPETGRFINIDDISVLSETQNTFNGLNLFAYCHNNPISRDDEYGYFFWFLIFAIVVGAVLGGTVNTVQAYQQGARGWNLVGAFVGGAIMGGAMGAVAAIGGAAGLASLGISVAGFGMSSSVAFITSIGIGMLDGGLSYTVESNMRDDMTFSINGLISASLSGAAQAGSTFFISFAGGRIGAYDKLFINKELGLNIFNRNQLGYSIVKEFMAKAFPSFGRTLLTKLYYLIGESATKLITVGGASAASRWLIDKLFGLYK